MDIYHVWCNLKAGVSDLEFAERTRGYLEELKSRGRLHGYRISRAKLGLRPPALREFHIMLEFVDLAQLDAAFASVAARTDPIEEFHHAVNSLVTDPMFALYRDFPDAVRVRGQERF
jgi:hypothetical protein